MSSALGAVQMELRCLFYIMLETRLLYSDFVSALFLFLFAFCCFPVGRKFAHNYGNNKSLYLWSTSIKTE